MTSRDESDCSDQKLRRREGELHTTQFTIQVVVLWVVRMPYRLKMKAALSSGAMVPFHITNGVTTQKTGTRIFEKIG